ncbi:hypothetical protein JHK82_039982 [Glycine max]|nr:hypothetical protein JHK86_040177 [Glycine max]KAG5110759.1 hypothetical protein JHK82_039982 [Glycine max]
MDLSPEKVIIFLFKLFRHSFSTTIHMLIADQIIGIHNKFQKLEEVCPAMEKQITKWTKVLLSSERLLGFSCSAFRTSMFNPGTNSKSGRWYPVGLAQMEQWIALL